MSGRDAEFREWSDKCHIARALVVAVPDLLVVPPRQEVRT